MSIRNEMRTKAVGSGRIQPMNGIENFESLSGAIDEVAQDALQQDGVAHDYGAGPARAKRKALAVSQVLVVATKPVDDGRKHDRRRLDVGRMLTPGGALQSANQAD